jgi:hypothetical protein
MKDPQPLAVLSEDWDRALTDVVPLDDMEHGTTSAIARWTSQGKMVQAPHWLVSQPTCVPVSPKFSRRKYTSKVRGSTAAASSTKLTEICIGTRQFSVSTALLTIAAHPSIRPIESFFLARKTGAIGGGSVKRCPCCRGCFWEEL